MKLSMSNHKQYLKLLSLSLIVAFTILAPNSAFSQEEQPQEEIIPGSNSRDEQPNVTRPVVGGSPWENSAGSIIGTSDDNSSNSSSASSNRVAASRPGTVLGPGDPPNPDVPFDANMNLIFLTAGVAFAFWIAMKKLAARASAGK